MNNRPVKYLQTDSRWKNLPYRTSKESSTIGSAGCGPTSMAMVIATWVDPSVTPVTTCNWAMKHGYKATGNGTYHSYFVPQAKAYGLECERVNTTAFKYMSASDAQKYHELARDYVNDGHLVIALMGKGNWTRGGHYILWYDNDGDDVLINDSASTLARRERNTFKLFTSQSSFYWVVKVPKEVISMTNSEVKKLIAEEVAALTGGAADDAPSSWAKEYWELAKAIGVTDGTYPKNSMTREQNITILGRLGLLNKELVNTVVNNTKDIYDIKDKLNEIERALD